MRPSSCFPIAAATAVSSCFLFATACTSSAPSPYAGDTAGLADGFQSGVFGPQDGGIHTPYVAGSTVTMVVAPESGQDLTGWTLYSTDPAIVEVASQLHTSTTTSVTWFDGGTTTVARTIATVTAVKPGSVTLAVLNPSGGAVLNQQVAVGTADEVKLYAVGDFLAGSAPPLAEVTSVNIVAGGKATFLVRYFANGQQLFGTGALEVSAPPGITATTTTPASSPANDFLFVTPSGEGSSGTIALSVGGSAVGTLAVTAVPPEAVTQIDLIENTATADDGLGLIYARTKNDASVQIYGASLRWSVAGQTLNTTTLDPPGDPADLFFFPISQEAPGNQILVATYGGVSTNTAVNEQTQYVASTAYAPWLVVPSSCAVAAAPGARVRAPSGSAFALALTLGLAAVARRRRQGPSGAPPSGTSHPAPGLAQSYST